MTRKVIDESKSELIYGHHEQLRWPVLSENNMRCEMNWT